MSHDEPLNRLQVFQTPFKICAGNVDCQHLSTTSVCRKIIFPRLFLGIETPENFETETAPSFLDSLHLEEAESNTFESDAACKCFAKFVMQPGFTDNMPVMPNPPAAVDVGAIVTEVVRQLRS